MSYPLDDSSLALLVGLEPTFSSIIAFWLRTPGEYRSMLFNNQCWGFPNPFQLFNILYFTVHSMFKFYFFGNILNNVTVGTFISICKHIIPYLYCFVKYQFLSIYRDLNPNYLVRSQACYPLHYTCTIRLEVNPGGLEPPTYSL